VAGYRRVDKKRNTDNRQNFKIFNLGGKNKGIPAELLQTYPKNANLPNPSENTQLPPKRKRGRGRPPMRWMDQFQ
jgi:hypothetical protein